MNFWLYMGVKGKVFGHGWVESMLTKLASMSQVRPLDEQFFGEVGVDLHEHLTTVIGVGKYFSGSKMKEQVIYGNIC